MDRYEYHLGRYGSLQLARRAKAKPRSTAAVLARPGPAGRRVLLVGVPEPDAQLLPLGPVAEPGAAASARSTRVSFRGYVLDAAASAAAPAPRSTRSRWRTKRPSRRCSAACARASIAAAVIRLRTSAGCTTSIGCCASSWQDRRKPRGSRHETRNSTMNWRDRSRCGAAAAALVRHAAHLRQPGLDRAAAVSRFPVRLANTSSACRNRSWSAWPTATRRATEQRRLRQPALGGRRRPRDGRRSSPRGRTARRSSSAPASRRDRCSRTTRSCFQRKRPSCPSLTSSGAASRPGPKTCPQAIAHGYYLAMQPPRGPVLVSIPSDDWARGCTAGRAAARRPRAAL